MTNAHYDAGFNSSGRSCENTSNILGMTPSQFRDGRADAEIFFAIAQCSFGPILVARSTSGCAPSSSEMPRSC